MENGSAFMKAAEKGNVEMMAYLQSAINMKYGAEKEEAVLSAKNKNGDNSLMFAASSGKLEAVKVSSRRPFFFLLFHNFALMKTI